MRHPLLALALVAAASPPAAATSAPPWVWVSPETGPWRLPVAGNALAIVDDARLVVATRQELMVVDRETGAVSDPVAVLGPDDGMIETVVRTPKRLLAFGEHDGAAAAWEISLGSIAARPLPLPLVKGDGPPRYTSSTRAMLAPDGARILVCGDSAWPTVRDATTLRVLSVARGAACDRAWWVDAHRVVLGNHKAVEILDVRSGTRAAHDGKVAMAGPHGRRFTVADDQFQIHVRGKLVHTGDAFAAELGDTRWSPDGLYAVTYSLIGLEIASTGTGGAITSVKAPLLAQATDLDQRSFVMLVDNAVVSIDLATGTTQQPEGHVTSVSSVVPRAGSVITASDELRVWRDGRVVQTSGDAQEVAAGDPSSPIAVTGRNELAWWDMDLGTRTIVPTPASLIHRLVRTADRVVIAGYRALMIADLGGDAHRWFGLGADVTFDDVDIAHERLALRGKDRNYIVDTTRRTVWSLQLPSYDGTCGSTHSLQLARDGRTAAASAGGDLFLFDSRSRKRLGRLDLPGLSWVAWTFLPSGELLAASSGEIALWDPATKRATHWAPPLDAVPQRLGVSSDGREIAIAYMGGRVLWANLDELRRHAQPRSSLLSADTTCTGKLDAPTFDDLLLP